LNVTGTGTLNITGALQIAPVSGSALNLNGGTINTAAIAVPAPFNWTSGTLNVTSNVTWSPTGGPTVTSGAFGAAWTLGANQTLMITGNETLGGAGLFSLVVDTGSTHYVTGTLTVSPTGTITQNAGSTFYAATFIQAGGTVNGTLQNQGVFNYQSGLFNGRLLNQGSVNIGPNFTAGNGVENDTSITLAAGQTLTANGAGLDNLGLLVLNGGTISGSAPVLNEFGATIQGHGIINPALSNYGTLFASGVLTANGGTTNFGLVQGNGSISGGFSNDVVGTVGVAAGNSLSINSDWTNAGLIALQGATARLGGGIITNNGTVQGLGLINTAVANTGTIEALGGTLSIGGALTNPAGGLLTAGTGSKLLVTAGLATNAGIINLTGGTFDNGGHPLDNTGQISGWGIFRTGGTGLDNNGSVTFSGGITTINGPVTNENGKTITVAQNPAIFTGLVTNNGGGTFNTLNTTATFAGGFTNNGNSNFAAAGNGSIGVPVAPAFGNASSLAVGGASTMRFNAVSGAASVGMGVTATVAASATLELAGSVSALGTAGGNRVHVVNDSTAAGVVVSGANQVVGGIDGAGNVQVNAGSDLTADHIIQNALIIGGTAGSPGLVTIDASDASGNPLDSARGGPLAASSAESGGGLPFVDSSKLSAPLSSDAFSFSKMLDLVAVETGWNSGGLDLGRTDPDAIATSVPEPSTLLLVLVGSLTVMTVIKTRRHRAKRLSPSSSG
jgi:fibronectin-binding autotransporter adhesin